MRVEFLIPFILGALTVLQAGLNRQIARDWGLTGAVLMNCLVLIVAASSIYFLNQEGRIDFTKMKWWFVLPGLMGLSLILGGPYVVAKIGALKLFIGIVAAQLLASILWDLYVEAIAVSPMRIAGAGLALGGALLTLYAS